KLRIAKVNTKTPTTSSAPMTAGLQPSDLIVLAARPSMGKAQPLDAGVKTVTGWKTMGSCGREMSWPQSTAGDRWSAGSSRRARSRFSGSPSPMVAPPNVATTTCGGSTTAPGRCRESCRWRRSAACFGPSATRAASGSTPPRASSATGRRCRWTPGCSGSCSATEPSPGPRSVSHRSTRRCLSASRVAWWGTTSRPSGAATTGS
ncbi:MAG: hypothetical protein MZV63_14100, partial [Marinilabiliales bacterium]|nr:hypothetical protein [Marinilabiliales bacterium]